MSSPGEQARGTLLRPRWWQLAVVALLLLAVAPVLPGCRKPGSRKLSDRAAVADTCNAAAKSRRDCKRCCPAASGWKYSAETGCTCLVPRRCPGGDRDLPACTACCERQAAKGSVLVGPVFARGQGCSCQYL